MASTEGHTLTVVRTSLVESSNFHPEGDFALERTFELDPNGSGVVCRAGKEIS